MIQNGIHSRSMIQNYNQRGLICRIVSFKLWTHAYNSLYVVSTYIGLGKNK